MHVIHDFDQDCRYLAVLPSVRGRFESRLLALKVDLPTNLALVDFARYGWIKPAMVVRLPNELFTTWTDFPELKGEWDESVAWALRLWEWYVTPKRGWGQDPDSLPKNWYCHPFDRTDDPFAHEVRRHTVESSECDWGQTVQLPSGGLVSPLAVFFPYWQAYVIAELLEALPLFSPILNVPEAKNSIRRALEDYDSLRSISDFRVSAVKAHWDQVAPAFEWLSRFRTLRGVASGLRIPYREWGGAVTRMLSDLGMSADAAKTSFRDELLVAWQHWQWFYRGRLPAACHEGLREDLDLAFEFLGMALNEEIDPEDPFWNPPDSKPRRWANLTLALPREEWQAVRRFCEFLPLYLTNFRRVVSQDPTCDLAQLRKAARRGWASSIAFRRFCLAFSRLDEHYTGFPIAPVGPDLRSRTPIDFFLLCALVMEKWLGEVAEAAGAPGTTFSARAETVCGIIASSLALPSDAAVEGYRLLRDNGRRTDFRSSTMDRSNPFMSLRDVTPGDVIGYIARCFVNCEIMRNYAAHHDYLDWELINGGLGMVPLESMLSLLVIWLAHLPTQ